MVLLIKLQRPIIIIDDDPPERQWLEIPDPDGDTATAMALIHQSHYARSTTSSMASASAMDGAARLLMITNGITSTTKGVMQTG